jgi:prepilin-type N-terminal cleavage/methylation domain-containing protein|tara:strand:- start:1457 stop:2167 length:711 start_codon:yes stop_codon:yes gene_type:complete
MSFVKQKYKNLRAFTLLELIIVMVLISMISALGIPSISNWNDERSISNDAIKISNFFRSAFTMSQQGGPEFMIIEINPTTQTILTREILQNNFALIRSSTTTEFETYCTRTAENNDDPKTLIWSTNSNLNDLQLTDAGEDTAISFNFTGNAMAICISKNATRFVNNLPLDADFTLLSENFLTLCHSSIMTNNVCPSDTTASVNNLMYRMEFTRLGNVELWLRRSSANNWDWIPINN